MTNPDNVLKATTDEDSLYRVREESGLVGSPKTTQMSIRE